MIEIVNCQELFNRKIQLHNAQILVLSVHTQRKQGMMMKNEFKVGDKVWIEMDSFGCNGMKVWGTVVGFTAKRIKVENEVRGKIGNYVPNKISAR